MFKTVAKYERARKLRALTFGAGLLGCIWVLAGWIGEGATSTLVPFF